MRLHPEVKKKVFLLIILICCVLILGSTFALEDLKCPRRKYTWARDGRSSQLACLDRFFINSSWSSLYSTSRHLVSQFAWSLAYLPNLSHLYFVLNNFGYLRKVFLSF
jgi:hypothetical protein